MEKLIPVALLLVTVLYSGIVSVNGKPAIPNENNLNRQQSIFKLSAVNMHFALRLYRQIASQPSSASKNIFFSPISISAALAMLSLGAKHNTLDQFQQVLWLSNMTKNDAAGMHVAFKYLLQDLTSESNELHLKMGNSLFIQHGLDLKNKFLEDTRQFYEAEASSVDFTEPQIAKEQINNYVRNHTDGKIQSFIKELDSMTKMILLNYVLFKGTWVEPFNHQDTHKADFHVDDTTTVEVQMMTRTGMFYHGRDQQLSSSVIRVPYKDNASLILILPDPGKLVEVEQNLTITNFQNLFFSLQHSSAKLHLPKLSLKASYNLKDLLKMIGIIDAFSDSADFTGISESMGLKVSTVIHEAVLDVDEKGTEAAAVTSIHFVGSSGVFHHYPQYVFNRPFLLLIAEHNTKSVLFAGRVMNPTV